MSGRHTGGVRGTRFLRADCPVCGRDTAGGNMSRDRRQLRLKPHKRITGEFGRREWCPGGGQIVTPRAYLPEVNWRHS
jgi:hypothetical protein